MVLTDKTYQEWLSVKAAADFCGVSRQFLFDHRKDGTGPQAHKRGRKFVYSKIELERWIESQKI